MKLQKYQLGTLLQDLKVKVEFVVQYYGRSDTDLNHEIKNWIGKYKRFKFFYASSPKNAFEKECKNYHAFDKNKIDNKTHPIKPENADYNCPYCQ